jgi:hypothetical protein
MMQSPSELRAGLVVDARALPLALSALGLEVGWSRPARRVFATGGEDLKRRGPQVAGSPMRSVVALPEDSRGRRGTCVRYRLPRLRSMKPR